MRPWVSWLLTRTGLCTYSSGLSRPSCRPRLFLSAHRVLGQSTGPSSCQNPPLQLNERTRSLLRTDSKDFSFHGVGELIVPNPVKPRMVLCLPGVFVPLNSELFVHTFQTSCTIHYPFVGDSYLDSSGNPDFSFCPLTTLLGPYLLKDLSWRIVFDSESSPGVGLGAGVPTFDKRKRHPDGQPVWFDHRTKVPLEN